MARVAYAEEGVFDKVLSHLYGRRAPDLPTNHDELQEHLWRYGCAVWLPAVSSSQRSLITEVDGRLIGGSGFEDNEGRVRVQAAGPVTQRLQGAYAERTSREGEVLPF